MSTRALHDAVLPIIEDTLLNIKDQGLHKSLSGPLQRGDIQTVKQHLKVLRHDSVLLATYRILSLSILKTLPDNIKTEQLRNILVAKIDY